MIWQRHIERVTVSNVSTLANNLGGDDIRRKENCEE
jgi:hypothetical protein